MEGCNKRLCSWWKTLSSSTRLLGLMLPLMVLSGLVVLLGSKSSNWLFASNYYPWAWSSVFPGATFSGDGTHENSSNSVMDFVPPVEDGGSGLELRRSVVGGGEREEALSVDYNLQHSAAPPLAIQVTAAEPPVRTLSHFFLDIFGSSFKIFLFLIYLFIYLFYFVNLGFASSVGNLLTRNS